MLSQELTDKYAEWAAEAESLQIPVPSAPFAPPLHDYTEVSPDIGSVSLLNEELAAWVDRYRLADPAAVLRHGYGTLTAMCFPNASHEVALNIGKILVFGFMADDLALEPSNEQRSAGVHGRLLHLVSAVTDPDAPAASTMAEPLRDLALSIEQLADAGLATEIGYGWLRYFLGVACENGSLSEGNIPEPDDYQRIRLNTMGGYSACLVQLAGRFRIPSSLSNHPETRRLNHVSHSVLGYFNDLLTCRAELLRGDPCLNAPVVLAYHRKVSLQDAVVQTAQLHGAAMDEFVRIAEHLCGRVLDPEVPQRADGNDVLVRYVLGLAQNIRGWQDWTLQTCRYNTKPADSTP